jgi:glycosyltransferase involved in cell wall biosynthesis
VEEGVEITETPNLLTIMYALGSGYGAIGIPYRILYSLGNRFDLVHSFDHKPNVLLPAIFRNKLKDTPLVADWSDWWGFTGDGSGLQEGKMRPVVRLETAMEEFVHREADWVTTISTGLLARSLSLGIPRNRVTWIPSGSPGDVIHPLDKRSCRERLGLPPTLFLLTHLGMGEEDLSMVLPALSSIRRKRPEVRLGVIGPLRNAAAMDRPGLKEDLILFGWIPFEKLPVYLGASDAFVLPLRETVVNRTRWPNKFGDYIAAGRPVLCSDVGDVATFVREESCGLVWRDQAELGDAIERLIDNPDLRSEMGDRARRLSEGRLSWGQIASHFARVYSQVGAQP